MRSMWADGDNLGHVNDSPSMINYLQKARGQGQMIKSPILKLTSVLEWKKL